MAETVVLQLVTHALPRLKEAVAFGCKGEWPFGPEGDMPGPEAFLSAHISWAAIDLGYACFPEASYQTGPSRMDLLLVDPRQATKPALVFELKMIGGKSRPPAEKVEQLARDIKRLKGLSGKQLQRRDPIRAILVGSWNTALTSAWEAAQGRARVPGRVGQVLRELRKFYSLMSPIHVYRRISDEDQDFHLLLAVHTG